MNRGDFIVGKVISLAFNARCSSLVAPNRRAEGFLSSCKLCLLPVRAAWFAASLRPFSGCSFQNSLRCFQNSAGSFPFRTRRIEFVRGSFGFVRRSFQNSVLFFHSCAGSFPFSVGLFDFCTRSFHFSRCFFEFLRGRRPASSVFLSPCQPLTPKKANWLFLINVPSQPEPNQMHPRKEIV